MHKASDVARRHHIPRGQLGRGCKRLTDAWHRHGLSILTFCIGSAFLLQLGVMLSAYLLDWHSDGENQIKILFGIFVPLILGILTPCILLAWCIDIERRGDRQEKSPGIGIFRQDAREKSRRKPARTFLALIGACILVFVWASYGPHSASISRIFIGLASRLGVPPEVFGLLLFVVAGLLVFVLLVPLLIGFWVHRRLTVPGWARLLIAWGVIHFLFWTFYATFGFYTGLAIGSQNAPEIGFGYSLVRSWLPVSEAATAFLNDGPMPVTVTFFAICASSVLLINVALIWWFVNHVADQLAVPRFLGFWKGHDLSEEEAKANDRKFELLVQIASVATIVTGALAVMSDSTVAQLRDEAGAWRVSATSSWGHLQSKGIKERLSVIETYALEVAKRSPVPGKMEATSPSSVSSLSHARPAPATEQERYARERKLVQQCAEDKQSLAEVIGDFANKMDADSNSLQLGLIVLSLATVLAIMARVSRSRTVFWSAMVLWSSGSIIAINGSLLSDSDGAKIYSDLQRAVQKASKTGKPMADRTRPFFDTVFPGIRAAGGDSNTSFFLETRSEDLAADYKIISALREKRSLDETEARIHLASKGVYELMASPAVTKNQNVIRLTRFDVLKSCRCAEEYLQFGSRSPSNVMPGCADTIN